MPRSEQCLLPFPFPWALDFAVISFFYPPLPPVNRFGMGGMRRNKFVDTYFYPHIPTSIRILHTRLVQGGFYGC